MTKSLNTNFEVNLNMSMYDNSATPLSTKIENGYKGSAVGTLKHTPVGSTAKVKRLNGEGALKRHILDMGITKGVDIYVRKVAPLGDPIEVTVRGYELSLRKEYAELIEVE